MCDVNSQLPNLFIRPLALSSGTIVCSGAALIRPEARLMGGDQRKRRRSGSLHAACGGDADGDADEAGCPGANECGHPVALATLVGIWGNRGHGHQGDSTTIHIHLHRGQSGLLGTHRLPGCETTGRGTRDLFTVPSFTHTRWTAGVAGRVLAAGAVQSKRYTNQKPGPQHVGAIRALRRTP